MAATPIRIRPTTREERWAACLEDAAASLMALLELESGTWFAKVVGFTLRLVVAKRRFAWPGGEMASPPGSAA